MQNFRSPINAQTMHTWTAVQDNGRPCCICLVAVAPDEGVCGSLDLRLPAEASGHPPPGVPQVRIESDDEWTIQSDDGQRAPLYAVYYTASAKASMLLVGPVAVRLQPLSVEHCSCANASFLLHAYRRTPEGRSWSMWQCPSAAGAGASVAS